MKWYEYLTPSREQTSGEDFADSIALIVIMALIYAVVFL